MKTKVEILNKGEFKPFSAVLADLCLDVRVKINGAEKLIRFWVSGTQMSIVNSASRLKEMVDGVLSSDIIYDFENVYYFTFTGSHFEQLQEKPKWANLLYR